MKKTISVLLLLSLLCAFLVVYASAAGQGAMRISSVSGQRGDTVTANVLLTGNPGLVTMTIRVKYDTSVLRLVGVSDTGLLAGAQLSANYRSGYTISWVDGTATANNTSVGTIATFTFQILEQAPFGHSGVTLEFVDSYDSDYQENSFSVTSGTVLVTCSHNYGSWIADSNNGHYQICAVCSDRITASHTWNSGSVIRQPTCKEAGAKIFTCKACNATKTESIPKTANHTYDHACDIACNVCGQTRTAAHRYADSWSKDQKQHWQECTVCKERWNVSAHTPGAPATETAAQTCTACGYVIRAALGHLHRYGTTRIFDASGHWYACTGCEEKSGFASHSFANACDPDCADCGFVREAPHQFGKTWMRDADSHWHTCNGCGRKQDEGDHLPAAQACSVCGYALAPDAAEPTEPVQSPEATEPIQKPEATAPAEDAIATDPTQTADDTNAAATPETTGSTTLTDTMDTEEASASATAPANAPGEVANNGFPVWILVVVAAIAGVAVLVIIRKKRS